MSNELNEYLKEKGASTDLRAKRSLAIAFGLPFDNGTSEQETALLLALKVGGMAKQNSVSEIFKVEVAFDIEPAQTFTTLEAAKAYEDTFENKTLLRATKLTTITTFI